MVAQHHPAPQVGRAQPRARLPVLTVSVSVVAAGLITTRQGLAVAERQGIQGPGTLAPLRALAAQVMPGTAALAGLSSRHQPQAMPAGPIHSVAAVAVR